MSNTLVAFFSATGATKRTAEHLADAIGADLYEISPAKSYTRADLNWQDQGSRSTLEMKNEASRRSLQTRMRKYPNMTEFFSDFPSGGTKRRGSSTPFWKSYDFSGKTIILFATSGGSGLGKTAEKLSKFAPMQPSRTEGC